MQAPQAISANSRLDATAKVLKQSGIALLLAAPSADLVYLLGYGGHATERPALLAVTPGDPPVMLVPELEAPRLQDFTGVRVVSYGETDDPFVTLAYTLPNIGASASVAVSDQMWASVLLGAQRMLPGATFRSASRVLRDLRMRKDPQEIELLARAGSFADAAFEELLLRPFVGRSESEMGRQLSSLLRDAGLQVAEWGPIVASGPHSASPHHLTGERIIEEGDAVVLDFGGTVQGYQADVTRTVHAGAPDNEFRHVYELVRQAQQAGVDAVRPGVPAENVDQAARQVIHAGGYGDFFVHRTGHGLGLDVHEEPYIVEGNRLTLEAGMTFSVEPGVYLPGRFGVRIEDAVAVTAEGRRRLNNAPRELKIVG